MSVKCELERTGRTSVVRTCPICGKRFYARSHQKLCRKCKQTVDIGRRRFREG